MARQSPEQERRRRSLLRQMEWLFVYLPPVLALLVVVGVGAFVAWILPLQGTSFGQRWLVASAGIAFVAVGTWILREWWERR